MSKALRSLNTDRQMFSILEMQLKRQDEQGQVIHTMFNNIKSMYAEFSEGFTEMKQMVQEVRDSVTLTNAECTMLHSAVATRSNNLTKDRYSEEDGEYKSVVGKYRRMIWKQLKQKFDVPKYNCIRRIDYDSAINFVSYFKPEDYI